MSGEEEGQATETERGRPGEEERGARGCVGSQDLREKRVPEEGQAAVLN